MTSKKSIFLIKSLCTVFLLTLLLVPPVPVSAQSNYYYLQTGSFRTLQNAMRQSEQFGRHNLRAIINGENVSDLGFWYRVYLGPFSSWKQAADQALDLRKKGIFTEKTLVRKKSQLILGNLEEQANTKEQHTQTVNEKMPAAAGLSQEKELVVQKEPAAMVPAEEKSSTVAPAAAQKPQMVTLPAPQENPVHLAKNDARNGKGRTVGRGRLAVSAKHTAVEVQTEISTRKLVTSNGTTTSSQYISVAGIHKNDLPTFMHMDTARIRYGLTDYAEIFADIGVAYDDISDTELVYGGGIRMNIFEPANQRLGKFYFDFIGEYLAGKYDSEYSTDGGYKWNKKADWWWFTEKIEMGVIRSEFTGYIGGALFFYNEKTERHLLKNIPTQYVSYRYEDELTQQTKVGFYGGIVYHFSPKFSLNIEGQLVNQESLSGALEYKF
jgi:hypothetical protein